MQIQFDVPADPSYPGRVAAVLSGVRLRKFGYIGAVLVGLGGVGLVLLKAFGWGGPLSSLYWAMVTGGLLSMLYGPWVRAKARRRSSGYAVEGAYDITDANIMMRSGSESGGIAWEGVTRVTGSGDFWVVYVDRMPATVIPRMYMSAGDAETLRAFMSERGLLEA